MSCYPVLALFRPIGLHNLKYIRIEVLTEVVMKVCRFSQRWLWFAGSHRGGYGLQVLTEVVMKVCRFSQRWLWRFAGSHRGGYEGLQVLTEVVMKVCRFSQRWFWRFAGSHRGGYEGLKVLTEVVWSFACCPLYPVFLLGLFFDLEDGGDIPPKRLLTLSALHDVISEKPELLEHLSWHYFTEASELFHLCLYIVAYRTHSRGGVRPQQ
jgi:hypothetical protein